MRGIAKENVPVGFSSTSFFFILTVGSRSARGGIWNSGMEEADTGRWTLVGLFLRRAEVQGAN